MPLAQSTSVGIGGFQLHLEVWLLVAGVIFLGLYVARVIAPKLPEAAITTKQRVAFIAGVVLLWVASDWPMHDISEEYLYSVHMLQHLLLTLVIPPLFLLATPEWLARLVLGDGRLRAVFDKLTHPIPAAVSFNAVVALTHWSVLVNASVRNGPLHYALHTIVVITAFQMWVAVCGPLPENRISRPAAMIYLFIQSVIPTVPGGWLTFAENPVYSEYDHPLRLWGISVVDDQQLAGLVMKLGGGFYLWTLITVTYARWATDQTSSDRDRVVIVGSDHQVGDDTLYYEDVEAELVDAGNPGGTPPPSTD